jgi:hypothetical protein
MAWSDQFWKPIKLKDGREIATLGDARELISTLPAMSQAEAHWQDVEEVLMCAATAPSYRDDALAAVLGALKAERLI